MPNQNTEIYFVTIIGIILGLLLVTFIVTILFLYQRRQQRQEQELVKLKDEYENEALRTQLEIQEITLKTISQELHDNIGQMLSVVKLSLSIIPIDKDSQPGQQLRNAQDILNKAVFDISDLSRSLHADRITQIGLSESIQAELASIKRAGIVNVSFKESGIEAFFDDQKSIFIFRIFQEALNNILKHAKASRVEVCISFDENMFMMELVDDGIGFDINEKRKAFQTSAGVGLKSLYNRAKLIGAELTIKSAQGKGTNLLLELPLEHQYVQSN